jgi:hypothetical protein
VPHPVRLSSLAALDLQRARDWLDTQEPGLGDTFLDEVNDTVARIAQNPNQYPIRLADLHRALVHKFVTASGIACCQTRVSSSHA